MTTHYRDFIATEAKVLALSESGKPGGQFYRNKAKRVLDMLVVIAAVPFVLPLVALLALVVASDGGKPFYAQTRIGRGGQTYKIWKLRTMGADAAEALQRHLAECPAARIEWETTQKLKDDPRITRIGRVLRKCSLDELPQLLNVFRGDMSLVGPRPMMAEQQEMYPGTAYYAMRPGISGYWQISERNETDFADRARYDNRYYADVSLATDLQILWRTVGVVLRGTGY